MDFNSSIGLYEEYLNLYSKQELPDEEDEFYEEVDVYDLVLEYLLYEGYCDDASSAHLMMSHISQDWVDEILEVYRPLPVEKMKEKYKKLIHNAKEAEILARSKLNQVPRGFRTITGTKVLAKKLRDKKMKFAGRAATISSTMDTHDPKKWEKHDSMVAQKRHLQAQLNVLNRPYSDIRPFKRTQNEEFDVYNAVLEHLINEGFCNDIQSAEVVIENMSEEWLQNIIELNFPLL